MNFAQIYRLGLVNTPLRTRLLPFWFLLALLFSNSGMAQNARCVNKGIEQFNKLMYQQSIWTFTECLGTEPDNVRALYYRGMAHRIKKQKESAYSDFKACIKKDRTYAKGYSGLGQLLIDDREYKKAIKQLDIALELDQYDALNYNLRGICSYQTKKYAMAIDFFNEAINYNPSLASAYNNRGSSRYYNQNIAKAHRTDIELAIKDFTSAINLQSDFELAYRNRAMAHSFLKQFDSATMDIQKAISLKPDEHLNYLRKGQILHDQKDYFGAIAAYKRAEVLNDKDAKVYIALGNAKIRLNQFQEAMELHLKAKGMDGSLAGTANYNIARVYALEEKEKQMFTYLKAAKRKGYFKNYSRVAEFGKEEDFKQARKKQKFKKFFRGL